MAELLLSTWFVLLGCKRLEAEVVELREALGASQQKAQQLATENSRLNCRVSDLLEDLEDAKDNPSRFALVMNRLRTANQRAVIENKRLRQVHNTLRKKHIIPLTLQRCSRQLGGRPPATRLIQGAPHLRLAVAVGYQPRTATLAVALGYKVPAASRCTVACRSAEAAFFWRCGKAVFSFDAHGEVVAVRCSVLGVTANGTGSCPRAVLAFLCRSFVCFVTVTRCLRLFFHLLH